MNDEGRNRDKKIVNRETGSWSWLVVRGLLRPKTLKIKGQPGW